MGKKLLYLINSLLILFCLMALFGGLVYRVYSLNLAGLAISLILAVISFIIIQYFGYYTNKKNHLANRQLSRRLDKKNGETKFRAINFLLLASYGLLILFSFYILFSRRTMDSIISPWQAAPKYFFIIYALATLLLLANIIKNKKFALLLLILHYFLSFSIALIIYRLGYGYDPFIHQATENLIDKAGSVEPKPFYYLGQYGLVVIMHKITALPLIWLDRLLVPVLAAIILPITLWRILSDWFSDQRLNLIVIASLLALTFPFLIVTTPQNLAYLLLITVILLGLACKNYYDFLIILLLSLTTLIIQPVAGLPALLFGALLAIYHSDKNKIKPWLYSLIIIVAILILPAAFYFLDKQKSPAPETNLTASAADPIISGRPGQENFILNFIYWYGFNLKFILLLLSLSGLIIACKFKEQCRIVFIYLLISSALFISYFLTSKIPFTFLISYERSDYPERIVLAAGLFLLPFIIISIYGLLEKISLQNTIFKSSWAILLTLLIATSLYWSYPRLDNYFNSRGYSVSRSDLAAVSWINDNAPKDFVVLANQQVSAAALGQFGFKKYYSAGAEKIFYYPIPTSSPLYQYYLRMVYDAPSRETMLKAMALARVDSGYFVINKYWWAFPKILAEAKLSANSWREIDKGEVYVFEYKK